MDFASPSGLSSDALKSKPYVEALRTRIASFLAAGQHRSAVYWSDKLWTLTDCLEDFVSYLQCLVQAGEYDRVYGCLQSRQLMSQHLLFKWLGLRCLYLSRRYAEGVALLETPLEPRTSLKSGRSISSRDFGALHLSQSDMAFLDAKAADLKAVSSLKMYAGRMYEQLDNKQQAVEAYREALVADVYCVEALEALLDRCLIHPKEEAGLLSALPLGQLPDPTSRDLLKYLYQVKSNKFQSTSDTGAENVENRELAPLAENASVLASKAERLYYLGDFRGAMDCVKPIFDREEMHSECLPVYICLLVVTKQSQKLFTLAHKLVDAQPDRAITWYAVGAYYFSVELYAAAKRLFQRATTIDPNYGPGWLAFGHALAVMSMHDQAMNSYLKAARVMEGCHLPQLYIGLEYCLTNNTKLGEQFFDDAFAIAPRDPHVLHEIGVMAYRSEHFESAAKSFQSALSALESVFSTSARIPRLWEPLFNNLGHTYRKLKRYQDSLTYHKKALLLCPKSPTTLAAIGLVQLLLCDPDTAISTFHKSLSLKRDVKHVTTLLSKAVDLASTMEGPDWPDPPVLPPLSPKGPMAEKAGAFGDKSGDSVDVSMNDSDVVMELD